MQSIRLTALLAAITLLAAPSAQANPIDDCNQSDDAEKQINGCSEFLQLDPFSPYVALAYGRRGEAYMRKGDLAHAIADFDQAVAIDGSQARFYASRGLAYRDKRDLDRAIADFSKAIELDSKFGEALINRCVVYEDKGEADLAIALLRLAGVMQERNRRPRLDRQPLESAADAGSRLVRVLRLAVRQRFKLVSNPEAFVGVGDAGGCGALRHAEIGRAHV